MSACKLDFFIGVGVLLLGVFFLLSMCLHAKTSDKSCCNLRNFRPSHIFSLIVLLSGIYLTVNNFAGYVSCGAGRVGPCPSIFPAGSTGYSCTNEYAQCAWTKNCITTKGFWPWESACECKCVNTAP